MSCPRATRWHPQGSFVASSSTNKIYSETLNLNNLFHSPGGANERHDSIPVHISTRTGTEHVTCNSSGKSFDSIHDRRGPRSHPETGLAQH